MIDHLYENSNYFYITIRLNLFSNFYISVVAIISGVSSQISKNANDQYTLLI